MVIIRLKHLISEPVVLLSIRSYCFIPFKNQLKYIFTFSYFMKVSLFVFPKVCPAQIGGCVSRN